MKDGVAGGGGDRGDGGGGDGGGGEVSQGLSQAEHIMHSIWYFDPTHVFAVTTGTFIEAKNMESVRVRK